MRYEDDWLGEVLVEEARLERMGIGGLVDIDSGGEFLLHNPKIALETESRKAKRRANRKKYNDMWVFTGMGA